MPDDAVRSRVDAIMSPIIDRARAYFGGLGVVPTRAAVLFRAMQDPEIQELLNDPEAVMLVLTDRAKQVIAELPGPGPEETVGAYRKRCCDAVRVEIEKSRARTDALNRR